MPNLVKLKKELKKFSSAKKTKASQWFFKTGKGQYGEGDVFWGIKVPDQRKVSRKFAGLSLQDIHKLLQSKVHEHRLTALFILVLQYKKADKKTKQKIYDFYLKSTRNINNWDLVDSSASYIVGNYLLDKPRNILYRLAKSKSLWERRISIIATAEFINHNQFEDTLKIAQLLLKDRHDLIHKAVGWMLREVGKRDLNTELRFLDQHYNAMPRTMLRYAIEKFSETKRKHYLKNRIQKPSA